MYIYIVHTYVLTYVCSSTYVCMSILLSVCWTIHQLNNPFFLFQNANNKWLCLFMCRAACMYACTPCISVYVRTYVTYMCVVWTFELNLCICY